MTCPVFGVGWCNWLLDGRSVWPSQVWSHSLSLSPRTQQPATTLEFSQTEDSGNISRYISYYLGTRYRSTILMSNCEHPPPYLHTTLSERNLLFMFLMRCGVEWCDVVWSGVIWCSSLEHDPSLYWWSAGCLQGRDLSYKMLGCFPPALRHIWPGWEITCAPC